MITNFHSSPHLTKVSKVRDEMRNDEHQLTPKCVFKYKILILFPLFSSLYYLHIMYQVHITL